MTIKYKQILVTGGAGFIGSNLSIWLKTRYPEARLIAADNLKRRGSETNLRRLQEHGIEFAHADIRNPEDLSFPGCKIDLVLECSAEPSVLAGYSDGPAYVINTNLAGTVNCLEFARRAGADILFLSTSRVYPVELLNRIGTVEAETRLEISARQSMPGISVRGVSENFPLEGARSLYGTTKLCSELIMQEYQDMYGLRYIINRCGVVTGPWQMGKVDQGVFALWLLMHYFKKELSYIGWGGEGKQVRDLLQVYDLAELVEIQLNDFDKYANQTFNVGGGVASSLSLLETTLLCQEITGNKIPLHKVPDNRPADLKLYITDNSRIRDLSGWVPRHTPRETLAGIFNWVQESEELIRHLWIK